MIRKIGINLLIILLWVAFGYGFYMLFVAELPARPEGQEGAEAAGELVETGRITARVPPHGRSLNPDALCLSTSIVSEPPWTIPNFQEAIQTLNVSSLRLPGGAAAGFWNWETNRVVPHGEGQEPKAVDNTLDSYLAGLQTMGAKPIVTLNMVTADLPNQLALLEAFEGGGVPVAAVELGYEAYLGAPDLAGEPTFPEVIDYIAEAEIWAEAIQQEFPEVAIGLSGAPPTFQGHQAWNSAVFELAAEQGLAVSFYPFPESPLADGQPLNEMTMTAVLGAPFHHWQRYFAGESAPLTLLPPDVPVWLTEYNIWPEPADHPEVAGTWAQSLIVMSQSLLFLGDERVEYLCPHPLISRQRSAAFLIQEGGFQLQAMGRTIQMLGMVMEGMTHAQEIEFSNEPVPDGVDYPLLSGWLFEGEDDRKTAVMINLGSSNSEINIDNLPEDFPTRYQQTVGDPNRRIRGRDGFEVINGNLKDPDENSRRRFIILPRYSVTTFSSVE